MGVGSDSGAGTKNGKTLKFKECVPIQDTYCEWVRVRDLEEVPVLHRFLERL